MPSKNAEITKMPDLEMYNNVCIHEFSEIKETQKEMGCDIGRIKEKLFDGMSEAIVEIKDDLKEMRKDVGNKPSGKAMTLRRILEVATVALVMSLIIGGGLLLFAGKLTPEDIVKILTAWKG